MATTLPRPASPPVDPPWLGPAGGARRARRPRARVTLAISTVVAAALLAPLVLIALDARTAGSHEIRAVLFRQRSLILLRHTVELAVLVVALSAVIGVAAAWATERTALPGRRILTVLMVIPISMPDFVVGYAWHSFAPRMSPLAAAVLVMTLGTAPLVYLPVAAALRRADPVMEDTARSLGAGRVGTCLRISLPSIRTAVLGGSVLVFLTVISEYGAFEILRFSTFTTEIFTEFQFEPGAAGALSIPLVVLGLLALSMEAVASRHRGRVRVRARRAPLASRWTPATVATSGALSVLVALGIGVPIGTLLYWLGQSRHSTLPAAATLSAATWTTVSYSARGALRAIVAALPVAMMSLRRRTRVRTAIERSTFVTQAVPGVVIALSLVFFATRYFFGLYQTSLLLVLAYAIIHFPLALVCVKTSAAQAPSQLVDVGASLGRAPAAVFARVTLPLLAPGLIAGFCLVFLTAVTELTATLVLAPIGVHTLATQFWAYQSEVAYGAAAPYALVIVAVAVVPGALLGLWFDREGRQSGEAVPV